MWGEKTRFVLIPYRILQMRMSGNLNRAPIRERKCLFRSNMRYVLFFDTATVSCLVLACIAYVCECTRVYVRAYV